jgi:hypothetical protein
MLYLLYSLVWIHISSVMVRYHSCSYLKYTATSGEGGGWGVTNLFTNISDDCVLGHHCLRWKKHKCNKLELHMTSAQCKGSQIAYLKLFKTFEKVKCIKYQDIMIITFKQVKTQITTQRKFLYHLTYFVGV